MALIKCPECGKEISDKSIQCIHCGYPLQPQPTTEKTICNILGEDFDLTLLDELLKQGKYHQIFLNSLIPFCAIWTISITKGIPPKSKPQININMVSK